MTVLDASAVLAYLRGEPARDEVRALLSSPSVLTSVNAAEVVGRLVRAYGWEPDVVSGDLALLRVAGMRTDPSTGPPGCPPVNCAPGTITGPGARSASRTAWPLPSP